MTTHSRRTLLPSLFLLLAIAAITTTSQAAPKPPDHWVGTWASAPMAANNGPVARSAAAPPVVAPPASSTAPVPSSTQTPTANPAPAPPAATTASAGPPRGAFPRPPIYGTADTTVREIVHLSIGGPQVRVVFTNEFGTDPLTIGAAHVAVSQGGSTINLVSAAGLTFGGRTMVTIPPGALVVSDPADVRVPAGSDLAISFFLPTQTIHQLSQHGSADQTSYTAPGNVVGAKTLDSPTEIRSWPFIKGVDVKVPAQGGAVVAFGDSITDGAFAA